MGSACLSEGENEQKGDHLLPSGAPTNAKNRRSVVPLDRIVGIRQGRLLRLAWAVD